MNIEKKVIDQMHDSVQKAAAEAKAEKLAALESEVKAAVEASKSNNYAGADEPYAVLLFMPHTDVDDLTKEQYEFAVQKVQEFMAA